MEGKPSYNISTRINGEILEIVSAGEVPHDSVETFTEKVQDIVKSSNTNKMLSDVRELKMPRVCAQAYSRIKKYPSFFCSTTAVVDNPKNADFQLFQEAAAAIFGIKMKYFTDVDSARDWLKDR
jgi:hypothetical protein